MTRLREEDVCHVGTMLSGYDQHLLECVGKGLAGIAAHSVGRSSAEFAKTQTDISIAVVPIAYGQGIICGFSQTVQEIVKFLGFTVFVTYQHNIAGLAEAVAKGAKIVFMADDDNFVAINVANGKAVDNGEATGRGYAAALDLMAGGLDGKQVLIIGAGPVGTGAAQFLVGRGARITAYDKNEAKITILKRLIRDLEVVPCLKEGLSKCKLVFEATPAANTIDTSHITPDTMIAAPGIPLGLDQQGRLLLGDRLIHDVLEIGVATMLFTVLTD